MSKIDDKRLLNDLHTLRSIGAYRTGVHRPTYSPEDIEARHWLAARLTEAGLDAEIDGIGNVIGRGRGEGPFLLIGSHLETQSHAGWLDGAMGVMFGLEVARALGHGIDVAGWADEEGHYGSFLGSRSFCGLVDEAELDACHNRDDGSPLRVALQRAGLAGRQRATIDPARYRGYLEAHIEQGDELECVGEAAGGGDQHRRCPQLPHRLRGRAEPRRHHPHGNPARRRRGTGAVGQRDRPPLPAYRRAAHGLDGGAHDRATGRARASSPAGPRCCSSSATPTRPCWTG